MQHKQCPIIKQKYCMNEDNNKKKRISVSYTKFEVATQWLACLPADWWLCVLIPPDVGI